MLDFEEIRNLDTPCFVFDEAELRQNFTDFQRALHTHWGDAANVGYSVKTNPLPWVVRTALDCGCLAEVVSDDEYALALECGCDAANVIFNGPVKGAEWIRFALDSGAVVNLDSQSDLDAVRSYSQAGKLAKVGVRVNIDLEAFCPGETVTGEAGGRFGWSYENGDLSRVISLLKSIPHVQVAGLHMHVTTLSRSQKAYRVLAEHAARIVREHELAPAFIDIGGGFFGGGPNNVGAYDAYAETIAAPLREVVDPATCALYVEPGGAVVCTPGYYVARVRDVKDTPHGRFVVSDFSRINIDHEMKKTAYNLTFFAKSDNVFDRQVLCGYTCMESDRLSVLENAPELAVGDMLVINFAGAYSMSFTPGFFIWNPPAVYVKEPSGMRLERPLSRPVPPELPSSTDNAEEAGL